MLSGRFKLRPRDVLIGAAVAAALLTTEVQPAAAVPGGAMSSSLCNTDDVVLTGEAAELVAMVDGVLAFAADQLSGTVAETEVGQYPWYTWPDSGTWRTRGAGAWISGFFPGQLWLMYEATCDETWRGWAELWTAGLEDQAAVTTHHNLGFQILTTFGAGYRLTQNAAYEDVVLQAASSLATRFNETVGATRSRDWGPWTFPVVTDNMMNLELLFWGAQHGDPDWFRMGSSHARTTYRDFRRSDHSYYHLVDYDPLTGTAIAKMTDQGLADESTWARGQAWTIHGMVTSYRETGDSDLRRAAIGSARYWLDNVPGDGVPYWDFDAVGEERDSSAAAIVASALIELGDLVNTKNQKRQYRRAGIKTLKSLAGPDYLAQGTGERGILLHGVDHRPAGRGIDVATIYGDYYFLQGLLRLKAALLAEARAADTPTGSGSVKGTARDSAGVKLDGVLVTVDTAQSPDPSASTNKGGKYSIATVDAGADWPVAASKAGYCMIGSPSVTVSAGATSTLDIVMNTGDC
jgi:unsaturated chondroitin disaccharide hydrolase